MAENELDQRVNQLMKGLEKDNVGEFQSQQDRNLALMKQSLKMYLYNPEELTAAERVFLKALVLYLVDADPTDDDKTKRFAIAQAFDYLHGEGKYNMTLDGQKLSGRPGVGFYLAKMMGIKIDDKDGAVSADAYRACMLDAASRVDASLAMVPVDKWEEWGKMTPPRQCRQLNEIAISGKLGNLITNKVLPNQLIPAATERMPEFLTVQLLKKIVERRPGTESYGFMQMICESMDDTELLKVVSEVIMKDNGSSNMLLDAAVKAYQEDPAAGDAPDPLAERSPTNPVLSTFDLIKKASEAGGDIKVDMARIATNKKELRKVRTTLLCFLNMMPKCPYDCGKCDICIHNKGCGKCRSCAPIGSMSCSTNQKDDAEAAIWRDYLTGRLRQAVDDMFRREQTGTVVMM